MVKLERLKTKTGLKWLSKNSQCTVMIWSNEWGMWWRPNRTGYTRDIDIAGVYTLSDAFDASGHCGAEKGIRYKLCNRKVTQESRGPARIALCISNFVP